MGLTQMRDIEDKGSREGRPRRRHGCAAPQGGVFIVVPLLLPAHLWAARTSNRAGRLLWTLLPSLGLASVAWATIYLTVGEDRPTIWLVPLLTLGASWAGLARVACQGATV
jgi:hypothetical protein